MRRLGTRLLVGALVALALAATLDAVIGREDGPPSRPQDALPARATPPRPAAELRAQGVSGTLLFTDEDCRVRAVRLPDLEPVTPPEVRRCRPDGRSLEACGKRVLEIRALSPARGYDVAGCAPRSARSGSRTILTGRDLVRAARRHPNLRDVRPGAFSVRATEVAWLGARRVAVLLHARVPRGQDEGLIVVFDGRRRVGSASFFGEFVSALRVSPRGSYVAARTGSGESDLVLLDARARAVPIPDSFGGAGLGARPFPGQEVAWSPDESWTAVATATSVYVFRSADRDARIIRLSLRARDLAWLPG